MTNMYVLRFHESAEKEWLSHRRRATRLECQAGGIVASEIIDQEVAFDIQRYVSRARGLDG